MATRHIARSIALQSLYEWDFYNKEKDLTEIVERNIKEFGAGINEPDFVWRIVKGVIEHIKDIDKVIEKAAPAWPINQISIVDRNILRIGSPKKWPLMKRLNWRKITAAEILLNSLTEFWERCIKN